MSPKVKKVVSAFLFVVATAAVCFYSWNSRELYRPASSVNFVMNTLVEQRLYGRHSEEAVAEVSARMSEFERLLSTYVAGSEIDQINQSAGKAPVKISPLTMDLLKLSKEYCQQSQGVFDITIAPVVLEWGVTSENPHVPDEETLASLLEKVDCNDLILDEKASTAMLRREGQAIDLGGIAKGYSCDIFREVAQKYNITSGYASIGGNIVVLGKGPNKKELLFGLRDPRGDESQYIGSISLEGKVMATSGDYERFFEQDGVRYHHILDPQTGYPADNGLISVSVISENGALADFLSTALFVAGKEKSLQQMEREDFQLILVDEEMNVYLSPSLKENFVINKEKEKNYTFHFYGGEE